jgi:hypothetical protein
VEVGSYFTITVLKGYLKYRLKVGPMGTAIAYHCAEKILGRIVVIEKDKVITTIPVHHLYTFYNSQYAVDTSSI